jgi:hypothetical protein
VSTVLSESSKLSTIVSPRRLLYLFLLVAGSFTLDFVVRPAAQRWSEARRERPTLVAHADPSYAGTVGPEVIGGIASPGVAIRANDQPNAEVIGGTKLSGGLADPSGWISVTGDDGAKIAKLPSMRDICSEEARRGMLVNCLRDGPLTDYGQRVLEGFQKLLGDTLSDPTPITVGGLSGLRYAFSAPKHEPLLPVQLVVARSQRHCHQFRLYMEPPVADSGGQCLFVAQRTQSIMHECETYRPRPPVRDCRQAFEMILATIRIDNGYVNYGHQIILR